MADQENKQARDTQGEQDSEQQQSGLGGRFGDQGDPDLQTTSLLVSVIAIWGHMVPMENQVQPTIRTRWPMCPILAMSNMANRISLVMLIMRIHIAISTMMIPVARPVGKGCMVSKILLHSQPLKVIREAADSL